MYGVLDGEDDYMLLLEAVEVANEAQWPKIAAQLHKRKGYKGADGVLNGFTVHVLYRMDYYSPRVESHRASVVETEPSHVIVPDDKTKVDFAIEQFGFGIAWQIVLAHVAMNTQDRCLDYEPKVQHRPT
jgi:hypothetical protein